MRTRNKRLLLGMTLSLILHIGVFGGSYFSDVFAKDYQSNELFEVIEYVETVQGDSEEDRMNRFNRKVHVEDEFLEVWLVDDGELESEKLKQLSYEDLEVEIKQKPKIAPIVHAPAVKPKLVTSSPIPYPTRAKGAAGKVTVCILVGVNGRPEYVSTAGSSGNPILDSAALESSINWRFSPALDDKGRPVRCLIYVPVLVEP